MPGSSSRSGVDLCRRRVGGVDVGVGVGVGAGVSVSCRPRWWCCLWLVTCVGVGVVVRVGVAAAHGRQTVIDAASASVSVAVAGASSRSILGSDGSVDAGLSGSGSGLGSSPHMSYLIMIDAGSSGSRIHVHPYTKLLDGDVGSLSRSLPVIYPSKNKKVKPGLSSYAKKPEEVVSVVSDLLAFGKAAIPMNQWKTTPIHIQATAGLRALPEHERDQILEVVRNEIQNSPFLFQRSWARIIPGQDEGINGWLATNYLMGVWDTDADPDTNTSTDNDTTGQNHEERLLNQAPVTTGVVEMGGASIQVTYVPKHVTASERELLYPMTIAGHTYFVYAYSYLSYGLQAAESAFQRQAIVDIEQDGNPCYPTGLRHSATGSFERCLSLVSRHLFDKAAACTHYPCSFNGIYQPMFSGSDKFLAIENFFYTTQFFGVKTDLSQRHLVSVLGEKGSEYCGLPWSVIKAQHANTPEQELSSYCFATAYEYSMLSHALGFSKASNIQAIREIQGKPIDWELGASLRELLRYQQMGAEYGVSHASEYNLELPASEHARTRVEQRVDARLGVSVSVSESGGWSLANWWLWLPFPMSSVCVVLVLLTGLAVVARYSNRNAVLSRCPPDVYAPKSPQHVV